MKDVLLTGFMGTGKTTVGQRIADRFGLQFVDLDHEIERREGRSISQIFEEDGELRFRQIEREALQRIIGGTGRIIATGGGTLIASESRQVLTDDHTVLCLTCEADELHRRLSGVADRPLLRESSLASLEQLLEQRQPVYSQFRQVNTTARSPDEVACEISRLLSLDRVAGMEFTENVRSTLIFRRNAIADVSGMLASQELKGDVLLITDETVAALPFATRLLRDLEEAGSKLCTAVIPPGESQKTLDTLGRLYAIAMDNGLDRDTVVIGLGGGVIGDLAGTFAATYLRGIPLVLVPTTLLAMVDACIGGKAAVDFAAAKNMVGSFYPARLVVLDPAILESLPEDRLADGLAEMLKIAFVRSEELFRQLETMHRPADVLLHAHTIRRAAHEKVRLVQIDPRDRGDRLLLNFGHTVGHALEAGSGYVLSHGQAVSVGMAAETWLAETRLGYDSGMTHCIETSLQRLSLPVRLREADPERVWSFLRHDKKRRRGKLRFAVPRSIGAGVVVEVDDDDARAAIRHAMGIAA